MKKHLLMGAMLGTLVLNANAYNVDDYIYTRDAKYKVSANNIVTNGTFTAGTNGLDGWTATDGATALGEIFTVEDGVATVNSGETTLTLGMYQTIPVSTVGTYIVSMKIKGDAAGYTDVDMNADNTNFVTAYFNTDGALATVTESNSTVSRTYGTDGVGSMESYTFTADDYTEIYFTVNAASEGKIVIDLRGLNAGLKIKDVECHLVSAKTDERVAQARLNWIKYILDGFAWTDSYEYYPEVVEDVKALEEAISNNGDITTALENLNNDFESFASTNLSNVLNTVNGGGEGNNSANWMNWTGKYNKLNSDYTASSGWSWTTDRWCHKTAAAENPMCIQWMRAASGTWDNIANLSCTLDKGTYFYSVEGQGGMMTLRKNAWARHQGYECASTQIFFGVDGAATAADTLDCGLLPTTQYKAFINKYEVAANDTKINLGIRCNQSLAVTDGFDVWFNNPVVYKVLIKGELTPEQKTYISNVKTQIEAVEGRIKVAQDYVADTQKELPWGKANLQKGIDETTARLNVWKAMTQDDILATMDDGVATYTATQGTFYVDNAYAQKDSTYENSTLSDLIMNAGVRYINNNFINVFTALNTPLTDMPTALKSAESTIASAMYSTGDKETYRQAIDAISKKYQDILASTSDATMEADTAALIQAKKDLEEATATFKKSAEMTPIATFDFENGYEKLVEGAEGEETISYVIKSNEGNAQMVFADGEFLDEAADTYTYGNAFQIAKSKSTTVNDGNILVFGHLTNYLELTGDCEPTADDVLRVDFTLYVPAYGNAAGDPTIMLLDAEKDTIGGFSKGTWTTLQYSSFGIDAAQFLPTFHTKVGGGKDELKDCFALKGGARVDYSLVFDFKAQSMSATTVQYYGSTGVCEVDAITEGSPLGFTDSKNLAKYISLSGYEKNKNTGRRASIDNLKIYKYKSTATTGISEVSSECVSSKAVKAIENGQVVITKAGKKFTAAGAQLK